MAETNLQLRDRSRSKWVFLNLYSKFLLVLIPIFLVFAVLGLILLVRYEVRDQQEEIAARIGNQAARVAASIARHYAPENPLLAHDLLASLAADRAFLCAELRAPKGGQILAAAPPNIGCLGQNSEQQIALAVGQNTASTLFVQFTDAELVDATKLRRSLVLSVLGISIVFAVIAATFGFRLIVSRPLGQLLAAIRKNSKTGERLAVKATSNDEFASIIGAFNEMLRRDTEREQELRDSRHKTQQLNAELDERVRIRTLELRSREAALFESEQRFSAYAQASSDWFWEMDENLRFSYFSFRFFEVTGVEPTMLLGKTREETGIPNVEPEHWQRHLDALHNRQPFRSFIHPREKPDGNTVWLSISGIPYFGQDGEFKGFRGTGNDITELVEARRIAEQARLEAENANRAKSTFLANMSHELRTPLNAVIGFSDSMLAEIFGPIGSKKYLGQAKAIHQSGRHLLDLVNDILDMAKIDAGAYELSPEPFNLSDIIADTCQLIQATADCAGVKLNDQLPVNMPTVTADKRATRQILQNLVSNAVKFTPEGGSVLVSAAAKKDDLTLSVEDTGIGIPANDIPNLTKPFNQGANKNPYITSKGTGLGLSIVASLVQLQHGKLGIYSKVGKGTRVSVFLPGVLGNVERLG